MVVIQNTERRHQFYHAFEAKALRSRSILTQLADYLTAIFGSTTFLFLNALFFALWIAVNLGKIPGVPVFDPYPFGLLTMSVSLEAIFLSIFVLVSQNRSSYVNALREEVHLRVNLIAEEEITKTLKVLSEIREKIGIKESDPELEEMLARTDTNYIERSIADQMKRANKPVFENLLKEFPDLVSMPIKGLEQLGNSFIPPKESPAPSKK